MKLLINICPDPQDLLSLGPEELASHVLGCLTGTNEPNIERAIIAKTLASGYHQSYYDQIVLAIEGAVDWLLAHCLLGASPFNKDLILLTNPVENREHQESR
jgi:hypothetical protein